MSNADRKARKAAGEKFVRIPKEGTPLELRVIPIVQDHEGRDPKVTPLRAHLSNRARTKIEKAIATRDSK